MSFQVVWACDACGAKDSTCSSERPPKEWHTVREGIETMDRLEAAKHEAIKVLLSAPYRDETTEISIAGVEDPIVWLGVGWLVGKGWAVYRGAYSFRFNKTGRAEAENYLREYAE